MMRNGGDQGQESRQRRILLEVLLLNVALVAGLLAAGLWADSSALLMPYTKASDVLSSAFAML